MEEQQVNREIKHFRKKYYINQLIKGIIITAGLVLGLFIIITSLEFVARLNTIGRAFLFFGFMGFVFFLGYNFILKPILFLTNLNKGISDEHAALHIGKYFPSISDRLLNFLQLKRSSESNALIMASLKQRATSFSSVSFSQAIDLRQNQIYIRYLAPSLFAFLFILAFVPQLFTTSAKRIVNYQEEFAPVAPFSFNLASENLIGFKNEDHIISLKLLGTGIPQNVYLVHKDRRIKMASTGGGVFTYTFSKIQ